MAVPTTIWQKATQNTTKWFTDSALASADTWDNANDTWDNAADTWDVLFSAGSSSRPTPTAWTKDL